MIRLAGGLLLVAAGLCLGLDRALALTRRVRRLTQLRRLIQDLETGVRYGARPLAETLAAGEDCPFRRLAAREDPEGLRPKEALARAGDRLLEDEGDRGLFRGLVSRLGDSDGPSQLAHLALCAAQTDQRLAQARDRAERQARLWVALGLFGGVTLCLILV